MYFFNRSFRLQSAFVSFLLQCSVFSDFCDSLFFKRNIISNITTLWPTDVPSKLRVAAVAVKDNNLFRISFINCVFRKLNDKAGSRCSRLEPWLLVRRTVADSFVYELLLHTRTKTH